MAENIKGSPDPISWEQFEEEIEKEQQLTVKLELDHPQRKFPPLFRGQNKASYFLETSLERYKKELPWERYHNILRSVEPAILSLTSSQFKLEDFPGQFEGPQAPPGYAFMIYLRHHGFPSPLLDWTISPYVAAFFAFHKAGKEGNVAIFCYRDSVGHGRTDMLSQPHIYTLGSHAHTHKRHYQQQCEYTICLKEPSKNNRIYCPYEDVRFGDEQDVLTKHIIPSRERKKVMAKLDLMNINAYTLFGSEDSLVDMLAYREIEIRER